MSIQHSLAGIFWTDAYGAYRWDSILAQKTGLWELISLNVDFDYMRGIDPGKVHTSCVVDDFGNLVKVTQ